MIRVGEHLVRGAVVDAQTRCAHYRTSLDVVAMRFHCCGEWYPCVHCHDEAAGHPRTVWPAAQAGAVAALCGVCAHGMSVAEYRVATECPGCGAAFNPRCALHQSLYFE
ncbi:hypothetical protein DY023_13370 [Microbacterium bovistercoris]|uniref:CHY-type domain-containing protein n=1 Tax=Microbacterium bovistercoris TaxID=2293570 RepID=A0A371NQN0_9MICO|nr:hypothetical protein DY023_13370 [Microbacterium bovistercoris]